MLGSQVSNNPRKPTDRQSEDGLPETEAGQHSWAQRVSPFNEELPPEKTGPRPAWKPGGAQPAQAPHHCFLCAYKPTSHPLHIAATQFRLNNYLPITFWLCSHHCSHHAAPSSSAAPCSSFLCLFVV
jgi:hypothetical protein